MSDLDNLLTNLANERVNNEKNLDVPEWMEENARMEAEIEANMERDIARRVDERGWY